MSGACGLVIMFLLSTFFLRPYRFLSGWIKEPFNRSLAFFPVLMGITFGIQTFFIIYKGSHQLKLKTTPLWLASLVSLAVATVTGLISIAFVPYLKRISEWRFKKNKLDLLSKKIKKLSAPREMSEVTEGSETESKSDNLESSPETTEEELKKLRTLQSELKESLETSCFETLNSCTIKLENDLESGFEKVKSTTNVLSKKLQLVLTLP